MTARHTLLLKFLREPLLHFLLAGAALFALSQYLAPGGAASPKHIEVTAANLDRLARNFEAFAGRMPDEAEMKEMVQDYILDEVLFQEALARGLDKNDTVIRDRLRQKLEFVCEEAAVLTEPTEEELAAYLQAHADYFSLGPQVSFKQVFFSRVERPATAQTDAKALLEELRAQGPEADITRLGDSAPFPNAFEDTSYNRVRAIFGDLFLEKIEGAEPGRWFGPIESEFGLHVVLVAERKPERLPDLATVREQVRLEWLAERKLKARDEAINSIRDSYSVRIAPYQAVVPEAPSAEPAGGRDGA